MNRKDILARLEALGNEKVRQRNTANGASENQFGVKLGDLRTLAKGIKADSSLTLELWQTGNLDAMLLSILLMRPTQITQEQLEDMVIDADFTQLADWLGNYVVKHHPNKEWFRNKWMKTTNIMLNRAAWMLTAERVSKSPEGLDLNELLERIETQMGHAPRAVQWTMNNCLAAIGIHFAEHRQRAVSIGEKLGVFRDYPTSPGCTSPFAPIWIATIVNRQS